VVTESTKSKEKSWVTKLQEIDIRYVYLLIFIVISVPVVWPMGLPLGTVSRETTRLYTYIDSLPARSIVLFINDQGPAAAAECQPGMVAMIRHCVAKGLRVMMYASSTDAVPFADLGLKTVLGRSADHPDYGKLYVNIGYIPQAEVGLAALATNSLYTVRDVYGRDLQSMEFFGDLTDKSAHSWRLAVYVGAGSVDWVVRQVTDVYSECKTGAAAAAVLATRIYPYYPHSVIGFLIGLRGSAEYEVLVRSPGDAAAGMDAQSLGHLAIVIVVVLGNIGYFASRRRGRGGD